MSRPVQRRRRRLQALALTAIAVGLVVIEPFPKGKVLLSLTPTHGVDLGDLPALALLLVASASPSSADCYAARTGSDGRQR
jgi:hypothetical protein